MTIERRMIVGIDDVKAVRFECSKWGARTPIAVGSLREVPQQCPSCNEVWWRSNDFVTHVTTTGPAASAFIQEVRVLAAITRDKKDAFRILLEFEEPK